MFSGLLIAFLLFQGPAQRASELVDAGVDLSNRGRFAEAAEKFTQALALDPSLAEAHYLMGLIRQQGGRQQQALQSFRAALKIHPGYGQAQARVCEIEAGRALSLETGYEGALAACRRATQLEPQDAEPHFHMGSLESKQRLHAAAARSFASVLRLDPKYPNAKYELAVSSIEAGNTVRGVSLLRELVAAEPGDGNARFQLGAALVKAGDCTGAIPHLEAAAEVPQKYYLLSGCYKKLSRPGDAAAAMARVKELREGVDAKMQGKFRAAVARQNAEAGKLDDAIANYRAAYELTKDPSIAIDLAVVLLRKGDAGEVLRLLQGATDPLARYQVALAHGMEGRQAEAKTILEDVVKVQPRFAEAWYQLGVSALALGDAQRADGALRQAVELRPDDPAVRLAWAEALARNGHEQEARAQKSLAGLMGR